MVRSIKTSDFIYTMQTYLQQKSGKPNFLQKCKHGRFKVFSVIFRRFSIHYSTPFDETNLNRSKLIECLPITSEQHCLKIRVFAAFGCWTLVHVKNNNAQARFLLETAKLPILQIILVLSPASSLKLCLLTQST